MIYISSSKLTTRHLLILIFKNSFFFSLAKGLVQQVPKSSIVSPTLGNPIFKY